MNCAFLRRHLGVFIDGELDPATLIDFEQHLAVCAGCQEALSFEQSFRRQVREALGGVRAPEGLRDRIRVALDAAPPPVSASTRAPLVRVWPLRARHAVPLAAAAAVTMAVGSGLFAGDDNTRVTGPVQQAGTLPIFEDVVRVHSAELPADVRAEGAPQRVASYFRNKVEFPVRPAEFDRNDVRLVGARLSNVRDRRAAALYYDALGRRMTVVVFDQPAARDPGILRVRFGGREVQYQYVRGYTVPVREHAGLTYAFAGDLDREQLLRLAASARVRE